MRTNDKYLMCLLGVGILVQSSDLQQQNSLQEVMTNSRIMKCLFQAKYNLLQSIWCKPLRQNLQIDKSARSLYSLKISF